MIDTTTWHWQSLSFRAMNTDVHVWLYSQTRADVLADVKRLFESFEKRLSRFDPYSELSRLNAQETFKASPTLIGAVEVALWAAQVSGGLYDPTILKYLEQAGYDRSFEQIEDKQPLNGSHREAQFTDMPAVSRPVTYRSVQVNRVAQTISKPAEVTLDLGGMGKGYTVDRASDRLQGLGPFLVNAGGDIFAYQSPPGQKGWQIDLVHPLEPKKDMVRLQVHHQALATSTIARRRWQRNGQIVHHLIDPRTGRPAQTDAFSVTVVAERTVLAEVYAKVALILGAEQGLEWLQGLPDVEGLIYTAHSTILTTPGMESLLDRLSPEGFVD